MGQNLVNIYNSNIRSRLEPVLSQLNNIQIEEVEQCWYRTDDIAKVDSIKEIYEIISYIFNELMQSVLLNNKCKDDISRMYDKLNTLEDVLNYESDYASERENESLYELLSSNYDKIDEIIKIYKGLVAYLVQILQH